MLRSISRIKILFLLIFSTIILTCTKDSTGPTGNNFTTSATIGPNGGILETTDFSLEVPAGSFSDEFILNLSISTDNTGFGESSMSESFIVKGLPNAFNKPLRIAIKYNGELSDSNSIAIGQKTNHYLSNDSSEVFYTISAKDSLGFLVGYHSKTGVPGAGKSMRDIYTFDLGDEIFQAISKRETVSGNLFDINYPKNLYTFETVTQFLSELNNLYTEITNILGVKFFNTNQSQACQNPEYCWNWPTYMYIKNISDKAVTGYSYSKETHLRGPFINFDGALLSQSNLSEAKYEIGKQLFSIAFKTTNNETYWSPQRVWWELAVCDWLEEYFIGDNSVVPEKFNGNELSPFTGLQAGYYYSLYHESHGHGMASLVKYLIDNNLLDYKYIGGLINIEHEQEINVVTALINNVNGLISDWWPDYFEKLVNSQIYPISSSVFLDTEYLGGIWNIDNNEGSESYIDSYRDLSAKRYLVNLNNSNFDENANLYLDATGNGGNNGIATLVFEVNSNDNLIHLVTAKNNSAMIPNLKQYYDNGTRQFLVVVVNSLNSRNDYLGDTEIELKIEVKTEMNLDYNQCTIDYKVLHDIHRVHEASDGNDFTEDFTDDIGKYDKIDGTFNGLVFSGSYNTNDEYGNSIGSIIIELYEDLNSIKTLNYSFSNTQSGGGNTYVTIKEIDVANLPKTGENNTFNTVTYSDWGETTCDYIVDSRYSLVHDFTTTDGSSWSTDSRSTTGYNCDNLSHIQIDFKKK